MSNPRVCKYYLQGNCNYGSSCRFVHSDGRAHRTNVQHYDDYQPKNNRNANQHYYEDKPSSRNSRDNYRYEQDDYHYASKSNSNNYNNRNNYNQRKNYYEDEYHNDYETKNKYQSQKENPRNDYSNKNYESKSTNFSHNYDRRIYADDENKLNNQSNYKNNVNNFSHNYSAQSSSNKHNELNNCFDNKYEQNNFSQREQMLKFYDKEIQAYRTQIISLHESSSWPFTCFHPIGHTFPVQSVGSLNSIEASFEEIRCDYYTVKNVCADPGLIHKQACEGLLSKVIKQRENVMLLTDNVLDDMIATFEKCKESKTNPNFKDSIQADLNSYWNMSVQLLQTNNAPQVELPSIVEKNENGNSMDGPKILMQTEVYGKMDNEAFDSDNFTNYIPIMPPPKKYCV